MTSIKMFYDLSSQGILPSQCTVSRGDLSDLNRILTQAGITFSGYEDFIFSKDSHWELFTKPEIVGILGGQKYSKIYGLYAQLPFFDNQKRWLPKLLILTLRLAVSFEDADPAYKAIAFLNSSLKGERHFGYTLGESISFPEDKRQISDFWKILTS